MKSYNGPKLARESKIIIDFRLWGIRVLMCAMCNYNWVGAIATIVAIANQLIFANWQIGIVLLIITYVYICTHRKQKKWIVGHELTIHIESTMQQPWKIRKINWCRSKEIRSHQSSKWWNWRAIWFSLQLIFFYCFYFLRFKHYIE